MCGIAGFLKTPGLDPEAVIKRQLERLEHRGPDSYGVIDKPRAIIGQTRLAVIDLATGDPPIANEDGSVGVAFNGEIYNYRALREELLGKGHVLSTSGDTEVIAHLAEDLDPVDVAKSLDGMFAFAVWDARTEKLFLCRDRVGKKPLYYWHGEGSFVFASELKALLEHPSVPRRLNDRAIDAYLTFGYVPTPETFYEGIRSVPPGHVLVLDRGQCELSEYWRPRVPGADDVDRLEVPLEESASRVLTVLTDAVAKRLESDVPLGAFLSGGIDSSAIVAIMSRLMDRRVQTFTIGFDDRDGFDERAYAAQVAEQYGTDHTTFEVQPKAIGLIEQLVWHYDQPFGDSSAIPTFLLAKLTKQHVTVALSGDGGDELFAGYERFAAALSADAYTRVPSLIRNGANATLARLPRTSPRSRVAGVRRFSERAAMGLPDSFRSWLSYVPEERRRGLLAAPSDWALDDYRRIWDESAGAQVLDRLLVLNIRTYLLDDLLQKADRMSMAHGLEVRSPFLDRDLVELALRLPRNHRVRGLILKRVLKVALGDLLPKSIIHRRKRGFGVPLDRWFRTDLGSYVDATLGKSARVRAHLRGEALDVMLSEHRNGARDHGHAIWALLTLETFLRREGW